jgi:hypothetical protein
LENSIVWSWNLNTSESRSKVLGQFLHLVLEKEEDQLDRSCEK